MRVAKKYEINIYIMINNNTKKAPKGAFFMN